MAALILTLRYELSALTVVNILVHAESSGYNSGGVSGIRDTKQLIRDYLRENGLVWPLELDTLTDEYGDELVAGALAAARRLGIERPSPTEDGAW
jgi:hypothetical protein